MIRNGINVRTGETYEDFIKKFEAKKTTDDCYTPPEVYEAVASYVERTYMLNRKNFVRPFYPCGDYENEEYRTDDVVVDNPPFSLISKIIKFYMSNNILFFLFAPQLTLFNTSKGHACALVANAEITYENGAIVTTSFVTNLEPEEISFRTAPELKTAIETAQKKTREANKRKIPKYVWPDNVTHSSRLSKIVKDGIHYSVKKSECHWIRSIESAKAKGKTLYGGGFLLSDRKAAELKAAELKAAELKAAEPKIVWTLSEEEQKIIAKLGKDNLNDL